MADSNRRHQASEACALSNWATGGRKRHIIRGSYSTTVSAILQELYRKMFAIVSTPFAHFSLPSSALARKAKKVDPFLINFSCFFKKGLDKHKKNCYNIARWEINANFILGHRQAVRQRTLTPSLPGFESLCPSQKILRTLFLGFFHLCRKAQHHLTEGQHHFERSENIIIHFRHKWTRLRQVANDVGYRPTMLRLRRKRCCALRKQSGSRSFGTLIDSWFLIEIMI